MPRGIYNRKKAGKTSMKRTKFPTSEESQENDQNTTTVKVEGTEISFNGTDEQPVLRSLLEKELRVASKRVEVIKGMLAKINSNENE